MRESLLTQFGERELPPPLASLLEHAYSISRGAAVAIRIARISGIERELGEPTVLANADADHLLSLVAVAAAMLGDRLEALSKFVHDESQSLSGDDRGTA